MKKITLLLTGFIVVICLLFGWILWYIRPLPNLNLSYKQIPLENKWKEMVQHRSLSLQLSEDDVNNLLKKELAANPMITPDIEVKGARFHLQSDTLTADLNLLIKKMVHAGVQTQFRLEWKSPYLTAVPVQTNVRSLQIPSQWAPNKPVQLNLAQHLPPFITIKTIVFKDHAVHVQFTLKLNKLIPGL